MKILRFPTLTIELDDENQTLLEVSTLLDRVTVCSPNARVTLGQHEFAKDVYAAVTTLVNIINRVTSDRAT